MGTPIWITPTHVGSVRYAEFFEKRILADEAVSYQLMSGTLPGSVTLSSDGLLSGTPITETTGPNPVLMFTFTVRATSDTGETANRTFTLSVVYGTVFVPSNLDQTGVRYTSNYYQYQIFRGTVNSQANVIWRVESGQLPPNASVSPNGSISGFMTGIAETALPLARELFLNPNFLNQPGSTSQAAFEEWLRPFLSQGLEHDYQFVVTLSNGVDAAEVSLTARIIYTKLPTENSWFQTNQITIDPNQYYFFIAVSDNDYIIWETESNLGSIDNGSISDLAVIARSYSNKTVNYAMKPGYFSKIPQQVYLMRNGLISGRISFKTYQDDPLTIPVNDDYSFTVRAYTTDGFSYSERTFSLHVNRVHQAPYDNLWVRAFSVVEERLRLREILNDPILFPNNVIYRRNDPFFGRAKSLKFLFSPGLQPKSAQDYYTAMENNHYTKNISFGEVRTAVAYDNNFNIKYEVVYLPVIDPFTGIDPITKQAAGLADTIDLRDQITNFYLENNRAYYTFKPNGLENMKNQLRQVIGYYGLGVLPTWMTSPQPIPGVVGQFYAPTGFIPAVVLAYTEPGGSDLIAFRLRNAEINFNDFRFEFDRYEFDSEMSAAWAAGEFDDIVETTFDEDSTIFENRGTRFIEGLDYFPDEDSEGELYGDKYLKFPKYGEFT